MRRASKFNVTTTWKVLLTDMQLDIPAILAHAGQPADLFKLANATLTPAEYFRLWRAVEVVAGEHEIALLLSEHISVEAFDPPIFASFCSHNLNEALTRLSQYKPLIGPMILDVAITHHRTHVRIECYGYDEAIPTSVGICELVFLTRLARMATRANIQPMRITLPQLPRHLEHYHAYFGCDLIAGNEVSIDFNTDDATRPFLTSNTVMWDFFEQTLNRRLMDLDAPASTAERVRAVLLESLPRGESSVEIAAQRLAISKRTLQRKLSEEGQNYQTILETVRSDLADHYLEKSKLSLAEISFLLGFREPNSFIRAYSHWKGFSPGQYRARLQ